MKTFLCDNFPSSRTSLGSWWTAWYVFSLSLEKERCKTTLYVYGTSRDLISNHLLLPSPESERITADQPKTDVRGAFNLLCVCVCVCVSVWVCSVTSVLSDSLTPYGAHQAPLSIGFSQARILEWVAISFSRASSWPRGRICTCLHFLHFRQILYPLSHLGSPKYWLLVLKVIIIYRYALDLCHQISGL